MAEIAGELRRRAHPDYMRDQARGAVVRKTTDLKNHAVRSPVVMGIAGAALGMVAARLIRGATAAHRRERIEWQPLFGGDELEDRGSTRYESEQTGGSLRQRAGELAGSVKDRAADLKDTVSERAGELRDRAMDAARGLEHRVERGVDAVRERLPSGGEIKERASAAYRFGTEEQPILGGLLAVGVGMALGFLLPSTEAEEKVIAPLRQRASDEVEHLSERVHELANKLDEKLVSRGDDAGRTPNQPLVE